MTAYDPDIEAILGGSPGKPDPHAALRGLARPAPVRRGPGRPPKVVERDPETQEAVPDDPGLTSTRQGVTVYWLSQVFKLSPETVRKRLADVPPLSASGKGYRYDVKTAAENLIEPKIDIERYMKTMRPGDLPALLQKEIWDARLKRQKWEAAAGDLWHTQDVLAVLSETFGIIKSTVQLWPDTVERTAGLTDEQRTLLVGLGDTLQDEIYRRLQEMAREKSTKATIHELDEDEIEDVL